MTYQQKYYQKNKEKLKAQAALWYANNTERALAKAKEIRSRRPPEYNVWLCVKGRCYQKINDSYAYYGGRGIRVCDEWVHSFEQFFKDMGPRPTDKHRIDRIDNDGDYSAGNCRWVTIRENNRNRPDVKMNTMKAKAVLFQFNFGRVEQKDLAETYGVSLSTIRAIVNGQRWVDCQP